MNQKKKKNHLETPNKHLFSINKQSIKKKTQNPCFLIHYNAIIYENKLGQASIARFLFFFFLFFFLNFANVFDVCIFLGGGGDCPPKPRITLSMHLINHQLRFFQARNGVVLGIELVPT